MKIGIIMGGFSSERDISLKTGKDIINNIDKNKYEVKEIILNSKTEILEKIKDIDFALIALHGEFGEDGKIQAILESMEIPYSGSGVLSSSLCMDKHFSKLILEKHGIQTPKWILVKDSNKINYDAIEKIGYPVVAKPNKGGSSMFTFLVNDNDDIDKYVKKILENDNCVIIEKYIEGEEYSTFLLDENVFPSIHIKSKSNMFDYNSKYLSKDTEKKIASIPAGLQNDIDKIARECWYIFDCKVYVRIDIIVSGNIPYILELNTLPSIREKGLVAQSVNEKDMSITDLIDNIIESSLKIKR